MSHMPFADGFIQVVNSKYNGNITRAMKNHEMHAWAQALSLVDGQDSRHLNLSSSREEAIAKILKDESLDSQSKLETLRILLK